MSWYMVEGPDDTGKTTFARGMERRGWKYEHCDASDTLPKLAGRMSEIGDVDNVVWDRGHLGEMAHHPDRMNIGWFRLIEAFLLERETRGVLLTVRHGEPSTWENDIFTHTNLVGKFQRAAIASCLQWGAWPDPMPRSQLFGWTEENEAEVSFTMDRADPEGLGGLANPDQRCEVLVLGEQQNPHAEVPWPFATRCGTELVWPAIQCRDVRVSNSMPSAWRRQANPFIDLHERWEVLGKPPVVALGKVTVENCRKAEVEISSSLGHPQWWLRFKAHELETYRYHLGVAILNAMRSRIQVEDL